GKAMEHHVSGASLKRQVVFWLVVLAIFVVFLYLFSSILLPFLAGMAIAYFLDPVADRLERLGLSRLMATVVILVSFVVVFGLALMLVIPVIVSQFNDFVQHVPDYVHQLQDFAAHAQTSMLPKWARNVGSLKDNFSSIMSEGLGFVVGLFG